MSIIPLLIAIAIVWLSAIYIFIIAGRKEFDIGDDDEPD